MSILYRIYRLVIKTIPMEKKCKKAKWLSGEALQIAVKRREKAMAPHSSPLAWKIPWVEEPGGLQSMGSLRVGHDWATSLSLFTSMHEKRKWQPTPVFLPGESQGRGAWGAAVYGIAQSRTRLKRLSSSSSSSIDWHSNGKVNLLSWDKLHLVL